MVQLHVALCGPCSPSALAEQLHPADAAAALAFRGIGGVPVSELACGLIAAGHHVTVVTLAGEPGVDPASFSGGSLEVHALSRRRDGLAIRDVYRRERALMSQALRTAGPDIVHAHWTYEFELAAQDCGLRHVTTAHDAPVTILRRFRDPYRVARLLVAERARAGIRHLSAVSPYLARRWRREMSYRGPVAVIPNSIPRSGLALTRSPSEHPTVLEVASSVKLKNTSGLLWAFAITRREVPAAQLRIVGPGLGAADSVASWARARGLADGVRFLGPLTRAELSTEYETAWLFAHAALEESFGLSLLEALASGVPVMGGRDSGGVPYVLGQGRAGWLTDVTNPRIFGRALADALAAGPSSQPPGAGAHARGLFSPQAVTAQYLKWYGDCLADRR